MTPGGERWTSRTTGPSKVRSPRATGRRMGGLPFFGTGWYRKHFTARTSGETHVWVEFDGAMANSTVWLNGHELGGRPYGYIGFGFDLTRLPEAGRQRARRAPAAGAGVLAVVPRRRPLPARVARRERAVHVGRWSTVVTTPRISEADADVKVATAVENTSERPVAVDVAVTITTVDGREAARSEPERLHGPAAGHRGGPRDGCRDLRGRRPARWDVEAPTLYTRHRDVHRAPGRRRRSPGGTRFGIRTLSFTAGRTASR